MEFDYPGDKEEKAQIQEEPDEPQPEDPQPQEPEPVEPQPEPQLDPENPLSKQFKAEKKRPKDPTEAFVFEMVESSKKPFEAGKPNIEHEDLDEIEALTKSIRDKIQKGK